MLIELAALATIIRFIIEMMEKGSSKQEAIEAASAEFGYSAALISRSVAGKI